MTSTSLSFRLPCSSDDVFMFVKTRKSLHVLQSLSRVILEGLSVKAAVINILTTPKGAIASIGSTILRLFVLNSKQLF